VFSFLRPVKIIEKNGGFVNTIAGSQYRSSLAKLNATQILRLLLQIIFLHLLLQAYDIITLLSNQTKKIPLAKFKDKPISFDLKGILD